MATKIAQSVQSVNALLDCLLERGGLKNDAALSRALGVAPPVISKLRSGRLELGATLVLNIYDTFDMDIRDIKAVAAGIVDVVPA